MLLQAGGTPFQVSELLDGEVVLRHLRTQEVKLIREQKLLNDILSGDVTIVIAGAGAPHLGDTFGEDVARELQARHASKAEIKIMADKVRWVRALREEGIHSIQNKPWVRAKMLELATTSLLDATTFGIGVLRKAAKKLDVHDGDPISVLPEFSRRGGPNISRLKPTVEAAIQETIDHALKGNGRIVKQHIVDAVHVRLQEEGRLQSDGLTVLPGASTIVRRIDERISAFELCLRNEGRRRALRQFREHGARNFAELPLEVIEIDDIDAGVFLIDSKTLLPVGRGYVTNGVDQRTLVPMGLSLSHQHRNVDSAIDCILDSLLPKDEALSEYTDLPDSWIGYGHGGINLMDNALYNHAAVVEQVQLNLKQTVAWSRPKQPTDKSAIEHFNHVIKNTFCVRLPGWRGVRGDPDSTKEGSKSAVMDEQQFRREYVAWVTSEYLNSPGIDGLTPRQRWQNHFRHHRPTVRWTRQQVAFMRMRSQELRFRDSGGLLRLGLRYQSDSLAELRKSLGRNAKVQVFSDRKDLGSLLVRHPTTGMLIKAQCIEDERYIVGMTERLQQLVLKQAREMGCKNPSLVQCVRARETLATRTDQMRQSTKLRIRQRGYLDAPPQTPMDGMTAIEQVKQKPTQVLLTDLEWSVEQLDLIELDADDIWAEKGIA